MEKNEFIKVEHVSRTFEEKEGPLKVLDDVSFSMEKGELTCLLGRAGAGRAPCSGQSRGWTPATKALLRLAGSRC
jgi:ABC-type glutathione transport system ATPase component